MREPISGLNCSSLSLRPVDLLCLPRLLELTGSFPANRGFCFRAFVGLITRTATGYHYGGNWVSSTGGIHTR